MTTAGKWMFLIGLVLSAIALAVAIWGIVSAVNFFQEMEANSQQVDETASVSMDASETRLILAQNSGVSCSVTAPDGSAVEVVSADGIDSTFETGEDTLEVVGQFSSGAQGEYEVECDSTALVSPSYSQSDLIAVGGAALGFLALIPLGLITVVGLIMWLVGRGRDRRAATPPPGFGGPPTSGHGAPPGGYGGPGGPYGQQSQHAQPQGQAGGPQDYSSQPPADPYGPPGDRSR